MRLHTVAKNSGFTFLEIIITIALLTILTALAIPLYVSLTKNARIATLQGLVGAMNSTLMLIKTQYRLDSISNSSPATVTLEGTSIAVNANGLPTPKGMVNALQNYAGFAITTTGNNSATFTLNAASSSSFCNVIYRNTGVITINTASC